MDPKKLFIVAAPVMVATAASPAAAEPSPSRAAPSERAPLEGRSASPEPSLARSLAPLLRAGRLCVRAFGVIAASERAAPPRAARVESLPTAGNGKGPPRARDEVPSRSGS